MISCTRIMLGVGALLLALTSQAAQPRNPAVPRLDELAGTWQTASDLLSLPALNSGSGSAQVARDVLAIGRVSFPPVTMTGETAALLVDGKSPALDRVRWYPYQVLRTAAVDSLAIETSVRMPAAGRGVLFRITLTNRGATPVAPQVELKLSASTSRHESWGWGVPREKAPTRFVAVAGEGSRSLTLRDTREELENCYAFVRPPDTLRTEGAEGRATWSLKLGAGETITLECALAAGERGPAPRELAESWARGFGKEFENVERDWQTRFDAMFTPGNAFFSGDLPVLQTEDAGMRRTYYMSAVSLLSLCRTTFPTAPRVYVSNSPESNCTMMYFWDTREFATVLALLDPVMLKQYVTGWLARGVTKGYAEEYLTGTLKGPWYSANDYSVFILVDAYLNVTGDQAFLSSEVAGRTVLDHLEGLATHWKSLVLPGRTLADYGKKSNLLECVPTYINEVASFNASNVWMMRRVAAILEAKGQGGRARELRADVARLLPAVLALYVPGEGVWDSWHRDGTRVQIRHVFDFATVGLTIPGDLPPKMRDEMTGFVTRELIVDHWMRAQSLSDVAAPVSNRPDHGPMGAYCAWPPETMAAMCEMGKFPEALDLLQRCVAVIDEGPYSQSRTLMSRSHDAKVRISPGPQPYNASNGGGFAEVLLRGFFGYQPDFLDGTVVKDAAPRGFSGRLVNVRQGSSRYELVSGDRGIETKSVTETPRPKSGD